MKKSKIVLTPELENALKTLNGKAPVVFLTGKAGTGKSTLLRHFADTTRLKTVITATTGIAALNAGGQTLHSFLKLRPPFTAEELQPLKHKKDIKAFKELECLVIDEASMLSPGLLDVTDIALRFYRDSSFPFGGVKIILIGDLLQLPPVQTEEDESTLRREGYDSPYFFSAKVLNRIQFEIVVLTQIFRQSDPVFIDILGRIRRGVALEEDLDRLNRQTDPYFEPSSQDFFLTLTPTNRLAAAINNHHLKQLHTKEHTFSAEIIGNFPPGLFPTDEHITLKKGAQIMFIRNDVRGRWVNGTIGIITKIYEPGHFNPDDYENEYDIPLIRVEVDDEEINVSKYVFDNYRSQFDETSSAFRPVSAGKFIQLPVRPAWAVTIHKSQGQTFEKVIIDLGSGTFAFGQAYVALSRCRTLEGIVLRRNILPADIKADPRVIDFIRNFGKN